VTKAVNSNDINHDEMTYRRTTGHALSDLMVAMVEQRIMVKSNRHRMLFHHHSKKSKLGHS
jgi:hypothetical protein